MTLETEIGLYDDYQFSRVVIERYIEIRDQIESIFEEQIDCDTNICHLHSNLMDQLSSLIKKRDVLKEFILYLTQKHRLPVFMYNIYSIMYMFDHGGNGERNHDRESKDGIGWEGYYIDFTKENYDKLCDRIEKLES